MCDNTIISNPVNITVNMEGDIFAPTLAGDGSALDNLNASNLAFGIVNSSLIYGNTLSNISASNINGLMTVSGNTMGNLNASNLTFGIVNSTLIYGNQISNINSSNITQPFSTANVGILNVLVISNLNSLTTNLSATTANVGTLNVISISNLNSLTTNLSATTASVGTLSVSTISGSTMTASTGFTGAAFTGGTFRGSTMSGTTITASTGFTGAAFNGGSLNITGLSAFGQFTPGLLAGNIRNILWGTTTTAGVTPGPVNDGVTFASALAGTNYVVFLQSRYASSQTLFTATINVKSTTGFTYYAYRITGVGATAAWDWMVIDYN